MRYRLSILGMGIFSALWQGQCLAQCTMTADAQAVLKSVKRLVRCN